MRGLWRCNKVNMNRFVKMMNAPNSEAARRGMPTQATNGCGRWNVYISRKPSSKENPDKGDRKIDVRCKSCGRRVKFIWSRHDNRGRPRPVDVLDRPECMPERALVKEMIARNNLVELDSRYPEEMPGFVLASEL
jgi:hypothetical protein